MARQAVIIIKAVNPLSVVCPESILVNALTTLGVPLASAPGDDFAVFHEAIPGGGVKRTWRWTLLAQSRDGKYKTAKLVEWWNDPAWLKANPTHELAILKVGSENLMRMARRIRETPHIDVLRKGARMAMIPSHLPEGKKAAALAKLEGA